MERTIITGGSKYTDIDVLASAIACQEMHVLQGNEAVAVLRAPFNGTIPSSLVRSALAVTMREYHPQKGRDEFVLVDISDPSFRESFVPLNDVVAVYDHHYGFEEYWKERLGERAKIEAVGSCATLLWEEIKHVGIEKRVSPLCINLLYTSILSNTLNFGACVTTERDHKAFEELGKRVDLPIDWKKRYFQETSRDVLKDLIQALQRDTKDIQLTTGPIKIAQLELWDGKEVLVHPGRLSTIEETFSREGSDAWILLLHSISERKTHFLGRGKDAVRVVDKALGLPLSNEGHAESEKLVLRKELLREMAPMLEPPL